MRQNLKKTVKLQETKRYGVFEKIDKLVSKESINIRNTIDPIYQRVGRIIGDPLRLAVLGEYNAGKSTFINRLLGAKILPIGVTPKTATTITLMYYDNPKEKTKYKVESIYERSDGSTVSREEFANNDDEMYALLERIQDSAKENKDINYSLKEIKAYVKNDILKVFHIVDTPGFNDVPKLSEASEAIFDKVNYVIWLFGTQSGTKTEKETLDSFLEKTPYKKNIYAIFNFGDALVEKSSDEQYNKVLNEKIKHLGNFTQKFANDKFFLTSSIKEDDKFWNSKFKNLITDLEKVVLEKDEEISSQQLEMELGKLGEVLIELKKDLSSILEKIKDEFKTFFGRYNSENDERVDGFKKRTLSLIKKGVLDTEKKVKGSEFMKNQYHPVLLKFSAYYYTAEKLKEMKEEIEGSYKEYIEVFENEFGSFRKKLVDKQVKDEKLRDEAFRDSLKKKMDELASNLKVKKNSEQLLIVGYIIGLLSDDYIYNLIATQENKENDNANINDDPIINLLSMDLDLSYFIAEIEHMRAEINDKFSEEIHVLELARKMVEEYTSDSKQRQE